MVLRGTLHKCDLTYVYIYVLIIIIIIINIYIYIHEGLSNYAEIPLFYRLVIS